MSVCVCVCVCVRACVREREREREEGGNVSYNEAVRKIFVTTGTTD